MFSRNSGGKQRPFSHTLTSARELTSTQAARVQLCLHAIISGVNAGTVLADWLKSSMFAPWAMSHLREEHGLVLELQVFAIFVPSLSW
jgi:hypothetical protein